jgi:hypothetical protein
MPGDLPLKDAANQARAMKANTPSGNWPTPTCSDAFTDKLKSSQQQEGSMHSVNLSQAVKIWPTPTANEMRTTDRDQLIKRREQAKVKANNGNGFGLTLGNAMTMEGEIGGQLNPTWVEWLMGWPLEWTDLRPSGTDKFQQWCASHGIPFTQD